MTRTLHPVNYSLSSETLKSNLSKGFSLLQQQQEFVDVTIATDGHFVKAHQNILALASPYLKGILQSAPCQHPIIFLCNVGHDILSYILEFVYTGEVQVPSNMYPAFINAAQQMHIKGLENLDAVMDGGALNDEENFQEVRNDFVTLDVYSDFIRKDEPSLAAPLRISDNDGIDKRLTENEFIHEHNGTINNTTECDLNNTEYENTVIDMENAFHQPNGASTETSVNHVVACHFINGSTEGDLSNSQNERTVTDIADTCHQHQPSEAATETSVNHVVAYHFINGSTEGDLSNSQNERAVIDIADTFHQHQPSEAATETSVNHVAALDLEGSSTEAFIEQDDLSHNDASSQLSCSNSHSAETHDQSISQDTAATPLYTISRRGSLLMILNRFLYNMHHCSDKGHKRRWRCIEYRQKKCFAYVDTLDEKMIARVNNHTHGFHDKKVISIGSKKNVFTSIKHATK